MRSNDLYIIAAGRGSRMGMELPKALLPINENEPCLTTTLRHAGQRFGATYVVTSIHAADQWERYFREIEAAHPELAGRVVNLPIRSGLGDGHAALQGLLAAECLTGGELAQDIVVMWGDVFLPEATIMDELLSRSYQGSGLLPAVWTENPYVSLRVDERMQCVSADFSKYGEMHTIGYHDQSVFRFSRPKLRASLEALHCALWKNGRYLSSGAELSLLFSFHHLYNAGDPASVYETRYPTYTFNTIDEVVAIKRDRAAARAMPPCPRLAAT
jgi:molybdopterin-guanine dinucleotide biosynthesis protein A